MVLVGWRVLSDVCKELAREDEEALLLDRLGAAVLGVSVAEVLVVEGFVACGTLLPVEVRREVLGDEAVEEHAEDVALEVPAVDAAAEVVGYPPDRFVELGSLGFAGCGGMNQSLVRRAHIQDLQPRLRSIHRSPQWSTPHAHNQQSGQGGRGARGLGRG